jgi:hypothetical protein
VPPTIGDAARYCLLVVTALQSLPPSEDTELRLSDLEEGEFLVSGSHSLSPPDKGMDFCGREHFSARLGAGQCFCRPRSRKMRPEAFKTPAAGERGRF